MEDKFSCILKFHISVVIITFFLAIIMLFQVNTYLVFCGLVSGIYFTFIYTLVTPVLSDQFGFSIKYITYYYNGVAAVHFLSGFLVYVFMM